MEDLETIIMELLVNAGSARSARADGATAGAERRFCRSGAGHGRVP